MPELIKPNSKKILNKYLTDHGIKQKYLAEKLDMSESNINYYLHGRGKITIEFIFEVSLALNISPQVFLNKNYKKLVDLSIRKEKINE